MRIGLYRCNEEIRIEVDQEDSQDHMDEQPASFTIKAGESILKVELQLIYINSKKYFETARLNGDEQALGQVLNSNCFSTITAAERCNLVPLKLVADIFVLSVLYNTDLIVLFLEVLACQITELSVNTACNTFTENVQQTLAPNRPNCLCHPSQGGLQKCCPIQSLRMRVSRRVLCILDRLSAMTANHRGL